MFGFDEIIPPLDKVPEEDRQILANFMEARNAYRLVQMRVSTLKISLLRSTNPAERERLMSEIDLLTTTTVAPAREENGKALRALLKHSVDVEGIKALLPAILAGVLQSANLPLLLEAFDIDGDNVKDLSVLLKEVLK